MITRGVILAGGNSRRMGRDKAQLPTANGTWLETLHERLAAAGLVPAVVGRRPPPGASWYGIDDDHPGHGPLGGLATALRTFDEECLVCAVDMPLLSLAALQWLVHLPGEPHGIVPRSAHGLEPCFARYTPALLPAINTALANGQRSLQRLAADESVTVIDLPDRFRKEVTNINTPEELATIGTLP